MIKDAAATGSWFSCCSSTAARPSPKPRHRHALVTTNSSDDVQRCGYSTPGKAPRMAVSVSGESLLRAVRYAMAEHGLADAPATVARVMAKLEPARAALSSPWPAQWQGQSAQPVRVGAADALVVEHSVQTKHGSDASRPPTARSDDRDRSSGDHRSVCLGSWDLRGRDEATLTPPERHPNTIMHLLRSRPPEASDACAPGV